MLKDGEYILKRKNYIVGIEVLNGLITFCMMDANTKNIIRTGTINQNSKIVKQLEMKK